MSRLSLFFVLAMLMSCSESDNSIGAGTDIAEKAISGEIAPDTVYRGYFVSNTHGVCGLILIDAGGFPDNANIQFFTSSGSPYFQAGQILNADCISGKVTIADLVTGQRHMTSAPRSLADAEEFTREYIEILLL